MTPIIVSMQCSGGSQNETSALDRISYLTTWGGGGGGGEECSSR